ncbi:MAG: hypothetical protein K0S18_1320 [Anaerocolumna sp.]|nr:hypothetical protein [Anaerocolumna sp.]
MGILKGANNMANFDPSTYSINDFLEWHERGQLVLAPKFQRRSVWKPVAKSFLIDSILREKPLPKIFIRQITDIKSRTTIREVVDGQQRLRTILDYINDGFKVSSVHNKECGNLYFSELSDRYQNIVLTYKFSVDTFIGVDDSEIMDVFARLNTYTTPLNKQELINAEFYGYFKQLVYTLSYKYNSFWIDNKLFTEYQVMRMNEVELTADFIIAMLDGIQNRKKIRSYYKQYDEVFNDKEILEEKFDKVISIIKMTFDDTLKKSSFRKPALFYSMFLAIYNLFFGMKGYDSQGITFSDKHIHKLRTIFDSIQFTINKDIDELTKEELEFVTSISRATSDADSRATRTGFIINELNKAF